MCWDDESYGDRDTRLTRTGSVPYNFLISCQVIVEKIECTEGTSITSDMENVI